VGDVPAGASRTASPQRVAVIGAGIQGIGVALELAARNISVDLYEKTQRVHGQASLANEGKIHVGYIYSNDPSLRTARQMVEGAWNFSPILRDWLERDLDDTVRSGPTDYLVHRESLLSPGELGDRYAQIAALNQDMAGQPGCSYFGLDGARAPQAIPTAEREQHYGPDVVGAFRTPEIAVDTRVIGEALERRVLDDPRIDLQLGSEVLAVSPAADTVGLEVRRDGTTEARRYDHAINASWEDLQRLDATAGLPVPGGSSFRLRAFVRLDDHPGMQDLRSCSIVLGPFGDVVRYASGAMFLSWYPVGRRSMTTSIRPPGEWSRGVAADEASDVGTGTVAGLRDLVPVLRSIDDRVLADATVHSGIVYARGTVDIHDRRSGFHERHAIGSRSVGRYHSVDTGKYTTAPLFARRLAERIADARA
jgi:glycine/D-amino acid oxidase-like deaminating enzyme